LRVFVFFDPFDPLLTGKKKNTRQDPGCQTLNDRNADRKRKEIFRFLNSFKLTYDRSSGKRDELI